MPKLLYKQNRWFRRCVRVMWTLTIGGIISIPLFVYTVAWNPFNLFGKLPSLREIENPKNDLSSELIAADGASSGDISANIEAP